MKKSHKKRGKPNLPVGLGALLAGLIFLTIAAPHLIEAYRMQASGRELTVLPHDIETITEVDDGIGVNRGNPMSGRGSHSVAKYQILTFHYTDSSGEKQEGKAWSYGHRVEPNQQVSVLQTGPNHDDFVRFDFFGVWVMPVIWGGLSAISLLIGFGALYSVWQAKQNNQPYINLCFRDS